MADAQARDRMRRLRAHRKGDHRLCSADCSAVRVNAELPEGAEPECVFDAVCDLLDEAVPPGDAAKTVIGQVLLRVAAEFDRAPQPWMPATVRTLVQQLGEQPGQPGDEVDELRARRAARRVEFLLGGAAAGSEMS